MSRTRCLACHHGSMSVFIEIEDQPVHCNLLWPDREAALNAPRGDIRLGFCQGCGMIYNLSFDPGLMKYTQAYENSLHFSPSFQAYAQELATRLIEKYRLYGKDIIEIGCGKGEFLSMLCEGGGNRGFGFDPSYDGSRQSRATENITFIRDLYSEAYGEYTADLICCRQVLEHIQHPGDFLRQIRHAIGNRTNTVVFFEVPNVLYTLRDLGIWDIIYEHCSYFSTRSLTRLFCETGFVPRGAYGTFGGQFLCLEASLTGESLERETGFSPHFDEQCFVNDFSTQYHAKIDRWTQHLTSLLEDGKHIVVWGAGSKGVTFLNTVKAADQIRYVVDINPHKQGMYVAGAGQQIVPPAFLDEYRPDTVLAMNAIYKDEISELIRQKSIAAEVVSV